MARRATYTKVDKKNFVRPGHVTGMGDKLWRGFQCLNPDCKNEIIVRDEVITDDFSIVCDVCGFNHQSGEVIKLFDYDLIDKRDDSTIESGPFEILHDDYIKESARLKYCIVCSSLKPVELFDIHNARAGTGRQGECNLCKQVYNSIKNQTRTVDQHREASQKRRLYTQFEEDKINLQTIYERFDGRCFKCGLDLSQDLKQVGIAKSGNLDHTLPVFYLWPLTDQNATLLCKKHNGEKAEKWPSHFYSDAELRRLSALTGIEYKILAGDPSFNGEALGRLNDGKFVEKLFEKFARYPEELLRLRNRVLSATGFDFLTSSNKLSADWTAKAEAMR